MAYNEIKQNFIKNFFNKIFIHSTVTIKKKVFEKMNELSPFEIIPDADCNTIQINLGDGINLDFNINWIEKNTKTGVLYTLDKIWFNEN